MGRRKIIIIDDDEDILEVLSYNLNRDGHAVWTARDGVFGLDLVKRKKPDLVLIDLMLPEMDGLDICRAIKNDARMPKPFVIIVTAKSDESDIVLGLGIGADDYITKPFSPQVLTARVRAVLRRSPNAPEDENESKTIYVGELIIDSKNQTVSVAGRDVKLTRTEFDLLYLLASQPERVFSRAELQYYAGQGDVTGTNRNIDSHVENIRRKMKPEAMPIKSIHGLGYRMRRYT